ncbi:hypothetical protein [Microvirga roseola]|uniref:hypothetical protein n=1 Tax=Microvirga roseola TaxID=2883126 RepID=UPI001E58CA59|nr:hypothetical protein [Microvirga roseola]
MTVEDENNPPEVTFTEEPVVEGAGGGTPVGRLTAQDMESDEVSYALSEASEQVFDLVRNDDGSYTVLVQAGVVLDD